MAVTYLLIVLLMTCFERWIVYPVPPADRASWSPGGSLFEDANFASADGMPLHGWLLEHPEPKRVILYFHGNGEHVADNADLIRILSRRLEATVLLFDYRGYGKSGGRPFERGLVDDGLAAQRWLAERTGRPADQITLVGRSIGGGVAVACAAELGAESLVLQSTFSRLTDAAAHHFPWLPVRLVMRNRYNSLKRIQAYDGPLLQSHGTADVVVPIALGRRLFDASPSKRKEFFEMPGLDHNDPQPREYYETLTEFLDASHD